MLAAERGRLTHPEAGDPHSLCSAPRGRLSQGNEARKGNKMHTDWKEETKLLF